MLALGKSVFSSLYEVKNDSDEAINKIKLDLSTLLSISTYDNTSVIITKEGRAFGIGDNSLYQIHSSLPQKEMETWTEIIILNSENNPYKFISAVCGSDYTTYHLYDEKEGHKICLATQRLKSQILNIGEIHPIALYGGEKKSAIIDANGSIILISYSYIKQNFHRRFYLPDGAKPIKIACGSLVIYALGNNRNIYYFDGFGDHFNLYDSCFSDISGSHLHFLAISSRGVVGKGYNSQYQLGLKKENPLSHSKDTYKVPYLTPIPVYSYDIISIFAGCCHSLFISSNGNLYKVGDNQKDIIHINTNEKIEFCFEGPSYVFITKGNVPENTPNRKIKDLNVFKVDEDYYNSIIAFKEKEIRSLRERIDQIRDEEKRHLKTIDILSSQIEEIKLKTKK